MQSTKVTNCSERGDVFHPQGCLLQSQNAHSLPEPCLQHLPRIGILDGNNVATGCVRGGTEAYVIFFLYLNVFFNFIVNPVCVPSSLITAFIGYRQLSLNRRFQSYMDKLD